MSGSRDVFAMTKSQRNNPVWESTTDALSGLQRNPLGTQFRTNSISNLSKRPSSSSSEENQLPSVLNSPPEHRPRLAAKLEAAPQSPFLQHQQQRIANPTRSPVVKRALHQPASPVVVVAAAPASAPETAPAPPVLPAASTATISNANVAAPNAPPASIPQGDSVLSTGSSPARRSMFSGMKKVRSGKTSPKGAGAKDSPARMRMKWALGRNENLAGLRDRGSSDQIIQEQVDNRSKACTELCETEKRYLLRLQSLKQVAVSLKEEQIISDDEARVLFSNLDSVEHLTSKLSDDLNHAMQNFKSDTTLIAPVLLQWQPYMKIYGVYLKSYNASQTLFSAIKKREEGRKDDKKSARKTMDAVLRGLEADVQLLQNWLAEPFQRVTRYPVLVAEILKHTTTLHPDYQNLEAALEGFRQLVHLINEDIRFAEQSEQYVHFKSCLHAVDAEQLQNEGNEKKRVLRFDGILRLVSDEEQPMIVAAVAAACADPGESSTDLLLRQLDRLDGHARVVVPQPVAESPSTTPVVSFMDLVLDVTKVPVRADMKTEHDDELKRYRAEQGGEDSSLDDSFEDSMLRHVFVLSDLVVVLVQQGKEVVMEHLIPLELLWVVENDADELCLFWPAGQLRLTSAGPSAAAARLVAGLPSRGYGSMSEWKSQLAAALDVRLKSDATASARRAGCSVVLEGGRVVMEEKSRQIASQHGQAGLTQEMILQLSQKKPKKKVALKTAFKARLGL